MHFGLYLHRQGIITAEELVAALDVQLRRLVPIGQLALEEGILSARDIFDILRAQEDAPGEHFGELAIELGRMNRDDLMRLLMIQADRRLPLAEILVWQGVLRKDEAMVHLNAYRRTRARAPRSAAEVMPRATRPNLAGRAFAEPVMAT
jgi:hypothetical protein